ncbi:MAG: GNAT family N-acetyltransferase [Phycisphaerales bacterium]|nr:GNAT family N-acetyltransferase [Phycisphaerales bacterium]
MIRYLKIDTNHALYPQECALRESVLLRPLGKDIAWFHTNYPEIDPRAEHFVAVLDHPAGERVVGCVLLIPHYPEPGSGKLMQMAVDPQRQGEGIGRRLVIELETRAFGELRLSEVFCHAQLSAMPFYGRLGWQADNDEFLEAGIPHHRMALRHVAATDD